MTTEPTSTKIGGPADVGALEQVLGVASLALGVPQTLAPTAFARLVGAPEGPRTRAVLLTLCGPRELAAAAGILAAERPWPRRTLQARLAGDVLDAALLLVAARSGPRSRVRLALAGLAASGIMTADALAVIRAKEQADGDTAPATIVDHPMMHGKAITVRAPRDEVERRWTAWDGVAPLAAASFTDAPGGRGTELRIDLRASPQRPTGPAAALDAVRKLSGTAYDQRVADDLRRFKQTVETGEVTRSDGSPDGVSAAAVRRQRPAHPVPADPTR
jgi:uncharacterized membrane protein